MNRYKAQSRDGRIICIQLYELISTQIVTVLHPCRHKDVCICSQAPAAKQICIAINSASGTLNVHNQCYFISSQTTSLYAHSTLRTKNGFGKEVETAVYVLCAYADTSRVLLKCQFNSQDFFLKADLSIDGNQL